MRPEHRAAIGAARTETAAVRAYLTALKSGQQTRRRRRSDDRTLTERTASLDAKIAASTDPIVELRLRQQRLELNAQKPADDAGTEAAFIEHAAAYSRRNGISRAAWQKVGVPASMLDRAGIR